MRQVARCLALAAFGMAAAAQWQPVWRESDDQAAVLWVMGIGMVWAWLKGTGGFDAILITGYGAMWTWGCATLALATLIWGWMPGAVRVAVAVLLTLSASGGPWLLGIYVGAEAWQSPFWRAWTLSAHAGMVAAWLWVAERDGPGRAG